MWFRRAWLESRRGACPGVPRQRELKQRGGEAWKGDEQDGAGEVGSGLVEGVAEDDRAEGSADRVGCPTEAVEGGKTRAAEIFGYEVWDHVGLTAGAEADEKSAEQTPCCRAGVAHGDDTQGRDGEHGAGDERCEEAVQQVASDEAANDAGDAEHGERERGA